jgi:hypothetical protein
MAKFKTYEEANNAFLAQKEVVRGANAALDAFRKENNIKKGAELDAKDKNKKQYDKLTAAVVSGRTLRDTMEADAKAMKPEGKKGNFTQKYEYPADVTTAAEKKKYRATSRKNSAPKEDKPAKEAKTEKVAPAAKADKKEVASAPAAEAKTPTKKFSAPAPKKKTGDD